MLKHPFISSSSTCYCTDNVEEATDHSEQPQGEQTYSNSHCTFYGELPSLKHPLQSAEKRKQTLFFCACNANLVQISPSCLVLSFWSSRFLLSGVRGTMSALISVSEQTSLVQARGLFAALCPTGFSYPVVNPPHTKVALQSFIHPGNVAK